MSRRALKKLQEERINSAAPKPAEDDGQEETDDDDIVVVKNDKRNLFDLLDDTNESGNAADEEDEDQDTQDKPATTNTSKSNKKKKKKGKKPDSNDQHTKKGKQAGPVTAGEDDIDRTLRELGQKYEEFTPDFMSASMSSVASTTTAGASSFIVTPQQRLAQLLSVSVRNLDPEHEMRRIFGSRVIKDNARPQRHQRPGHRAVATAPMRRTYLATPKEHWPPFKTGGMSMEYLEASDGEMWFTFSHSRAYSDIQYQFLQVLRTHNPEHIAGLLRMYPYHIDTALQLSEILKHNGDIAQASELVEQVLFAFERRFHSMFNMALGTCRLSYDRVENRPFFIALFRHVQYLTRKGCWRTALEVNKLLLSLNPHTDPLGALLMIDFMAVKAKELDWLSSLYDQMKQERHLNYLPNFAYSMALAQYTKEGTNGDHSQSSTMLQQAISSFPFVLPGLYEKATITDARIADNDFFHCTAGIGQNTAEAAVLSWLRSAGSVVLSRPDSLSEGRESWKSMYPEGLSLDMYRHIFVTDFNNVRVPPSISGTQSAHDPLPPISMEESIYDSASEAAQAPAAVNSVDALTNFLQNLLPWVNRNEGAAAPEEEHNADGLINRIAGGFPGLFPQPNVVQQNGGIDAPEGTNGGEAFIQGFRDTIARLGLFGQPPVATQQDDEDDNRLPAAEATAEEHHTAEEGEWGQESIEGQWQYWSDAGEEHPRGRDSDDEEEEEESPIDVD
ncbi:hypothetical protein SmJEL517_g00661 [Synchytrium microbalum]|uniref:Transcription factor 25 n=1 Tax=Synchytrium microbalum TaxID=1806994 RepID=A0A507C935_9FUNG|nr:uncharacterized protein SmJEL517_g00661 [Synchytrium microbalum]TPX37577.1 hypothetical protein SmJEL517_g00661 [Synchytrium microbalum]